MLRSCSPRAFDAETRARLFQMGESELMCAKICEILGNIIYVQADLPVGKRHRASRTPSAQGLPAAAPSNFGTPRYLMSDQQCCWLARMGRLQQDKQLHCTCRVAAKASTSPNPHPLHTLSTPQCAAHAQPMGISTHAACSPVGSVGRHWDCSALASADISNIAY